MLPARKEHLGKEEKYGLFDPLTGYLIKPQKPANDNFERSGLEKLATETEKEISNAISGQSIIYLDKYLEDGLKIPYNSSINPYINRRQNALHDFSDRVPGKHMHILPENVMGGILGFTYLGENFITLRADLTGETKKMVDIHESIHTPDEYETRILTNWIMSDKKSKYIQ